MAYCPLCKGKNQPAQGQKTQPARLGQRPEPGGMRSEMRQVGGIISGSDFAAHKDLHPVRTKTPSGFVGKEGSLGGDVGGFGEFTGVRAVGDPAENPKAGGHQPANI